MRPSRALPLALLVALACLAADSATRARLAPAERDAHEAEDPGDWFFAQRAFPGATVNQAAFDAARGQALADRARQALSTSATPLVWTQAGPYNIGGRVTALAVLNGGVTAYLGAADGGVFRSTNSGVNWTPIFDNAFGTPSIGAITIDPTNANTVYVGTGEANASVDSYDGSGMYRSDDAGATWSPLGLATVGRIARIAVDPANSSRIFVAAMGSQFSTGPNRGLYRSENGGATWSRVLFVSDSTGAGDVVVNPVHPETLFCATWERVRHQNYRRAFGPECGIWRSADHGDTWTLLSSGLPAPSDNVGRIALGIAASRPSTIYAQIGTGVAGGYKGLGLYRSLDAGQTWARRDGAGTTSTFNNAFGGFCWYFGSMGVDPMNPDRIFCLGQSLLRSLDGGATYATVTGAAHVDEHAIWIDPTNVNRVYLGNDGGFFSSTNGGSAWTKSVDLPISQFYACDVDASNLARTMGGTQDNNSIQTFGSPTGWTVMLGGDGFYALVDPTNPDIVFAESQYCNGGAGPAKATDGGVFFGTPTGFVPSDRYNWCTPIVLNPLNHNVVLTGSQRVYRSTDNGDNYSTLSGDLTTNPVSQLGFGTISTIDVSRADTSLYYVGTDDGRVWRSPDRGFSWAEITAGLPLRSITRVTADRTNPNVVYVTLSGFGSDEHAPHVFRSADRGTNWTSIAGNLPDAPANDLVVDTLDPNTLYLGTDVGVYATRNLGAGWFPLGTGLPIQAVFDLALHAGTHTLVAGTHGRSLWKLDLGGLPLAVPPAPPAARLALSFPSPNPSRANARFTLEVSRAMSVEVAVFDASGRRVATLFRGACGAGQIALAWDGRDAAGRRASAGAYWVRAASVEGVATRSLVRLE
jgi:photosystem II stability/assembly factor-like uncharacterized protein